MGAMNLCLRVISGADKPFDYRCSPDVVIGRSQTADLCIPRDRFLSKRHARMFEDTGAWYVEDLGSRNTTLLNGQPVDERIQVFEGDVIRLSDCHMEVTFVPMPRSDDNTAVYRSAATVLEQTDSKERLQETPGEPSLKRYVERLALLKEIHRALANQMSRDELFELILVANPASGSRHNRGAAADITLYDLRTGAPVRTVGGYDEFSDRSFPDYPGGTSRQRWLRELLQKEMEAQGFDVYEFEWWHFDRRDWRKYPILNQTFDELTRR